MAFGKVLALVLSSSVQFLLWAAALLGGFAAGGAVVKAMNPDTDMALVKLMDSRLAQVKQQVAALKPQKKKKIVLVSLMSSYGGKGCIFDDMCKEAGVINGVSAAGIKNGQQITKEMLVKIDPDLLIMPVYNDHGNFDIKKYNQKFLEDPSLQTMRAIKSKQLFYPNEGYIYNCSQDVVFGVQEIAHAAYGEAFAIQGAQQKHNRKNCTA